MRALFRSLFVFFFLLLALSYPIAYYIGENYHTYNKQSWILGKSQLELDYAVLGSSRVFNMVDIGSMDKSYGKKGINIGSSGSGYAENYLVLSEFLSKNRVEQLILNVDEFSFNSGNSFSYPFHEYEFLHLLDKYDHVAIDFIPAWKYYLWKLIPAAKYIEFNNKFTTAELKNEVFDKSMGTKLENKKRKNDEFKFRKSQEKMDEMDKKYFLKIVQLCTEKKVEIVFISTPVYFGDKKPEDKPFKKYVDSVSISLNIPYLACDGLLDCNNRDYFKDNTHTNAIGSMEYSSNLGTALKKGIHVNGGDSRDIRTLINTTE